MQALKELFLPSKARESYDGGVVGLEIEVEGEGLIKAIDGWRCERDGSLRGENVEYVFPSPIKWEEGYKRVKKLRLKTKMEGAKVFNTGYAGIHVHVNVTDMTPIQIWRYAMAYYTVEPLLLEWCGEDRKNNLFCLSLAAANLPIGMLRSAIEKCQYHHLRVDDIRYSALNFKALSEYGSFEFRSMYSTLDETVIDQWVKMLLELREFACTDYPVQNLLNDLSIKQEAFLRVLMPTTHVYLEGIPNIFDKMLDAVREIQWDIVRFREDKVVEANAQALKQREPARPIIPDGMFEGRAPAAVQVNRLRFEMFDPAPVVELANEPEIDL